MKEWITSKFTLWKVREKVWLEMTNLHMGGPKKLQMKRTGPFEVKEVISWTAIWLCIPLRWKIYPVFHASLLTTYKETTEHGPNFLQLPPDLVDGEEDYEVKAVIGHWGKPRQWTFLIHWKGYSMAEDTWELEQNLGNAKSLFEEYKSPDPRTSRSITTTLIRNDSLHPCLLHLPLLPHGHLHCLVCTHPWQNHHSGKELSLGSVTVEDLPIPFSPFSLADCTMLDHFSLNDFVAIAFPDIAGDLDIQI